jgi:adenylate kinase family enzyme
MRRILVIGNSGGGKSTLARKLGEKLGLPVIHLDVLFWKPGWVERDRDEYRASVVAALAAPDWICDGNFTSTFGMRMALSDTIIWIDRSRFLCLFRAIRRAVTYAGGGRPDMTEGCDEKIDFEFYRFILTYDRKVRPKLEQALAEHGAHARLVQLTSDREVAAFLTQA